MSDEYRKYTYRVKREMMIEGDIVYYGLCNEFPSLYFSAKTEHEAFIGIRKLVQKTIETIKTKGEYLPDPIRTPNKYDIGKYDSRFVSVYEVSRHYGGPEEGGWWYDWRQFTGQTYLRRGAEKIQKTVDTLKQLLHEHQPRYDRFSCANRGEPDLVVIIEMIPGENESTERPRYE